MFFNQGFAICCQLFLARGGKGLLCNLKEHNALSIQMNTSYIQISLPEVFSKEKIDENLTPFNESEIKLKVNLYPIRAYACMEWVMPTAAFVVIFKPYFESFMSEMGKDHYDLLKKSLQNWSSQSDSRNTRKLTANGPKDAKTEHYSQSLYQSIKLECKDGRTIKLLFDVELDQIHWSNAITELLDLFEEYYTKDGDSRLDHILGKLSEKKYHQLYAIIDKESKKLEFHDDNTILKKFTGIDAVDPI